MLKHEGTVRAGHIAFWMLLGIFPFLVFLTHATGLFLGPTYSLDVTKTLFSFAPAYLKTALQPSIDTVLKNSRIDIMSIAFLASIWFPSKAIDGIRGGFVHAYGPPKKRSWVLGRAVSALCVILGVFISLVLSLLLVLGPLLSSLFSDIIHFHVPFVLATLRNLTGFAIFVVFLWFLHRILSGKRFTPQNHLWTGAIIAAIMWVAIAIGFGLFLKHSTSYELYYGTLAGIAISMLFFYYSALVVLLSAEINATLDANSDAEKPARSF